MRQDRLTVQGRAFELKIGQFALIRLVVLEGSREDAVVFYPASAAIRGWIIFELDDVDHGIATLERVAPG